VGKRLEKVDRNASKRRSLFLEGRSGLKNYDGEQERRERGLDGGRGGNPGGKSLLKGLLP